MTVALGLGALPPACNSGNAFVTLHRAVSMGCGMTASLNLGSRVMAHGPNAVATRSPESFVSIGLERGVGS